MLKKRSSKKLAGKRGKFKRKKRFEFRKKVCRFCTEKMAPLDFKDVPRLYKFLTEKGKILPSRISGNCARHQRQLARTIKKSRAISLLPYVVE